MGFNQPMWIIMISITCLIMCIGMSVDGAGRDFPPPCATKHIMYLLMSLIMCGGRAAVEQLANDPAVRALARLLEGFFGLCVRVSSCVVLEPPPGLGLGLGHDDEG